MNKTAAIAVVTAFTALSTALITPAAFAGEKHRGDRDCHSSCSRDDDDRGDDGDYAGDDNDGGLLDLGGVVDSLLDTVGNLL